MSTVQKQDLVIFSDNSVISKELCTGESHDLIFITSTPSTSPFWLINAIMEAKILGSPFSLNNTSVEATDSKNRSLVTISSFTHNAKFYTDALSKLKIGSDSFQVIDFLTDFVIKNFTKPKVKILSELLDAFPSDSHSCILLEQPEILLTLLDGLTSEELNRQFLMPLMRKCGLLIVSSNIAFNPNSGSQSKDTVELSRFLLGCFYKSIAVLSLKPLDTGRASDVTGSFRITRGGASDSHISCHVVENEYLYLNQKENTKLFYR